MIVIAVFYLFAFPSFAIEFTHSFRFGDKTTTYSADRTWIFDIHNFAMTTRIEARMRKRIYAMSCSNNNKQPNSMMVLSVECI